MKDPALFFGMLELAKVQLISKITVGQLQASGVLRGKSRPRIVSPHDGLPVQ
jgi:hypothetical protein